MTQQDEGSKLHIDSDWKAEAQAEKEKLAQKTESAGSGGSGAGAGGMPPATFETLVSTLVTQALFAMGAIADPRTGQRVQHLELARHHIDMLTLLEEKTKGNLSEEEGKMLTSSNYELRSRYIQLSSAPRPGQVT